MWYKSATKLVLIAISLALIAGLFTGKVEPKDFKDIAMLVFAFYFGQKVNQPAPTI